MAFPEVGARLILQNESGFLGGFRSANNAVKDFGSQATTVSASTIALGNVMADIATGAARLLANAIGDVTKAAAGFLAGSVGMAADLEAQMDGVQAVLGASNDELTLLNDLVVDLGIDPNLKVSSLEAAGAIEVLAKNGVSATEILDGAARSTVLLSNATGTDFRVAADIATDAMAIFGKEAGDLGGVVDGVSAVMTKSKFDATDYRLALAQGASVAATYGITLDEFNTLIAATASNFASGSDAGTSFKTFVQRLVSPTDKAAEQLQKLGISVFDADGNIRNIFDILEQFNGALNENIAVTSVVGGRTAEQDERLKSLKSQYQQTTEALADYGAGIRGIAESEEDKIVSVDRLQRKQAALSAEIAGLEAIQGTVTQSTRVLSEEEKAQALTAIFGADAIRFASAAFSLNREELEALHAEMAQVDAEEAARTRVDNFRGAMDILSGVIEAVRLEIGGAFLPILTELARKVTLFVEQNAAPFIAFFEQAALFVGTFSQSLMDGQGPLTSFTTAMAAVGIPQETIDRFNSFVASVSQIITVVSSFVSEHSEALKGALIGIGAVLAGAAIAAGIAAIGSAIAALASPIGIVIVAAGLIGAAWAENWGGIREKTQAVVEFLTPHFENLKTWLAENIPIAIQTASDFWENTLLPAIRDFAEFVKSDVVPVVMDIVDWLQVNVPIAIQAAADFWQNTLQPALVAFSNFVKTDVIPVVMDIVDWLQTNLPPAIQAVSDFINDFLIPAFVEVAGFIKDPVIPLLAAIGDLINAVLLVALEALAGAWQNILLPALQAVGGFIADTLGPVWDTLNEKFGIAESATKTYEDAIDSLHKTFEKIREILGGVTEKIKSLTESVKNFKLPDILTPGSPTPFELALIGIAEAMDEITKKSETFGAALGMEAVAQVLEGSTRQITKSLDFLLGRAGVFAKLGGGFASFFAAETVDPLKAEVDRLEDFVSSQQKILADLLGISVEELMADFTGLALQAETATGAFADNQEAINAMHGLQVGTNNLSQATVNYRKEQEKILALEEKRQQLAFLQSQLDLIEFVREKGLDASILEGITFGIEADAGQLVDAMTQATTMLIDAASANLDIASPSKVFAQMGRQIDAGLAAGIGSGLRMPERAMDRMMGAITPPATGQQIMQRTINSQSRTENTFNLGGNTINSGMDAAMFDASVRRAVAGAL
jgi:TP901 family phage tail tape measure protein